MPLTATEQQRLGNIRPDLRAKLGQLLQLADARGFTVAVPVDGGLRSTARQTALYADSLAQGGGVLAYPVGKPGSSYHEYGAAFDLHIVAGGNGDDGAGSDADYRELADMAIDVGLKPGYYFSNSDPFHFQLDEPLAQVQHEWAATSRAKTGTIFAGIALGIVVLMPLFRRRR